MKARRSLASLVVLLALGVSGCPSPPSPMEVDTLFVSSLNRQAILKRIPASLEVAGFVIDTEVDNLGLVISDWRKGANQEAFVCPDRISSKDVKVMVILYVKESDSGSVDLYINAVFKGRERASGVRLYCSSTGRIESFLADSILN